MCFLDVKKMASKTQRKITVLSSAIFDLEEEINNYCTDCLYEWCSKRNSVILCTMKTKGLFECRSCILKMLGTYEREFVGTGTEPLVTVNAKL